MSTPRFKVKPILFTTSVANIATVQKAVETVWDIMNWTENVKVAPFEILTFNLKDRKPRVVIGFDGKVRIDHASFVQQFTNRALEEKSKYPGHQFIILVHMTAEEKLSLGLEPTINGTYWPDKNWYMEGWVATDPKAPAPGNRTTHYRTEDGQKIELTNLERLLLHEAGHAFVHFSGRKEELEEKYGGDPVHYFDYGKRDVAQVFREVSFKQWSLMAYIVALATQLIGLLKVKLEDGPKIPGPKSRIDDWAMAIQIFEDYVPPGGKYRGGGIAESGSLSWRNHNPGNLRWSPYEAGNRNNFSYFNSYEEGWHALIHQLRIAADGRSKVYRPTMTIRDFFHVYAPSEDNNHPDTYAKFVADYLKVPVETLIKDLI